MVILVSNVVFVKSFWPTHIIILEINPFKAVKSVEMYIHGHIFVELKEIFCLKEWLH